MDTQRTSFSVLMLPWLAHGHISPFLELAKKLAKRNFHVYLCSTPINLSSIKERITEEFSLSIQTVDLPLPSLPELPPHFHTTKGLPIHLNSTLKKAFEMASPTFSNILKTLKPDFLINDLLQPWAASVASIQNIPVVQFIISSAAGFSPCCHLILNPDVEYPFPDVYPRGFELAKLIPSHNSSANDGQENREGKLSFISCDIMLIASCNEIEGKYINYLTSLTKRKIIPVGPLINIPVTKDEPSEVMEWLGKKDCYSTVFVSFGSECFLSKEEMEEIARGLELSNVNFIWVIRFPLGEETLVEEALPEGYLERIKDRGMIIKGWAPQTKILGHSNIAGFLSHCGWNSAMESMNFGVPIIAIPMQFEQPMNARLMVECGLGMEVTRDDNGQLHREEVEKVIRDVVVEKKGVDMRRKARDLSENIRLMAEKVIDEAVEELAQLCEKSKASK